MVERGAGTSRRKGSESRIANGDQHRRGSLRPLQKPMAVATAGGTWNETSKGAGSSPASGTKRGWWSGNRFSAFSNDYRFFTVTRLGGPGCRYITRWVIDLGPLGSLRLHHWYGNDDQRAMHDHPWGFLTLVLWGSYDDVTHCPDCELPWGPTEHIDHLRAGSIRWRSAEHAHTVRTTGAWTLLWTQPKRRYFGFLVRRGGITKWVKANKWFGSHGHPPCE